MICVFFAFCRLIEHGFTSAPTQYRLYGRRFLQVWWPNQQCQSTEGGWLVIQTGLNLTRLTPPCYNNTTCMQILHKKIIWHTQSNLSTVSELSEMKPNLVDRTCELLKWVCNYRKLHNKTTRRAVMVISPLAPDQTRCGQMELEGDFAFCLTVL